MAKPYPFVDALASRLEAERARLGLSYARLGAAAEVDGSHVYRILQGRFATLGPNVLRICNVLHVTPPGAQSMGEVDGAVEAQLAAEAIAAWDKTEEGAQLLLRVLRALRPRSAGHPDGDVATAPAQ